MPRPRLRRRRASEYFVFGDGDGLIEVDDGTARFFSRIIRQQPDTFRRAAGRTAFALQRDLKQGINRGNVEGVPIPRQKQLRGGAKRAISEQSDDVRRRHLRRRRRFTGSQGTTAGQRRLSRAIGFQRTRGGAVVGFLSRSAAEYAEIVQEGYSAERARGGGITRIVRRRTTTVTPAVRRYFASVGLPLRSSTKKIVRKRFDLIGTFFRRRESYITDSMDFHINNILRGIRRDFVT